MKHRLITLPTIYATSLFSPIASHDAVYFTFSNETCSASFLCCLVNFYISLAAPTNQLTGWSRAYRARFWLSCLVVVWLDILTRASLENSKHSRKVCVWLPPKATHRIRLCPKPDGTDIYELFGLWLPVNNFLSPRLPSNRLNYMFGQKLSSWEGM